MPAAVSRPLVLAVCAALAVGACSGEVSVGQQSVNPTDEAEGLIEGTLADEAGLGPLSADCPDAGEVEAGGSFDCTGTTEDGQVIEFTATVTEDGAGEVNSTNLATPADIPRLAEEAARVLSDQNGVALPSDAVTCAADRGLVFELGATLDCQVTDPQSGEVTAAVITITDPDTGGFEIQVTG